MNCDAFERRLQYLLDQRVSPRQDAELYAHGLSCGECQAHLEMQERLLEALSSFPPPRPSDDFADRIVEAVCHGDSTNFPSRTDHEGAITAASLGDQPEGTRSITSEFPPQSPSPRYRFSRPRASRQLECPSPARPPLRSSLRRKGVRWGIGMATCLGLLILGTFHQHVNWEPTAERPSLAELTRPPGGDGPSGRAEGGQAGMALVATLPEVPTPMVSRMAAQMAAQEARIPMDWGTGPLAASSLGVPMATPSGTEGANRSGYPLWLTTLTAQLPDVPPESLQSVDQIAGGLRPIAETLGAAFDTIRRSLPIVDREDRPAGKPQAGLSSRVLIG